MVPLADGNYVITDVVWNNGSVEQAGAVTCGNGITGVSGVVSSDNSLLGTRENNRVGLGGVRVLTNGSDVISSPDLDSEDLADAGALTFVGADTGLTGIIDETNSLVGGHELTQLQQVTVLTNGNYVVSQSAWRKAAGRTVGAATLVDGTIGVTGLIDPAKSLTGTTEGDSVSRLGVTVLPNGNHLVTSFAGLGGFGGSETTGALSAGLKRIKSGLTQRQVALSKVMSSGRHGLPAKTFPSATFGGGPETQHLRTEAGAKSALHPSLDQRRTVPPQC